MINPNSEQSRAQIAWVSAGQGPTARLCAELGKSGYDLHDSPEIATPESSDSGQGGAVRFPDMALVDLRSSELTDQKITALCKRARALTPTGGIVFLASPEIPASRRARLRKSGELCLTRRNYALLADTCRERLRLSKLAEVTGERLKTLASISRLSDFPPLKTKDKAPSVLIAGSPTPAALAAINAAMGVASGVTCTLSVGQTMRALDHGKIDCAVFLPTDENDVLFSLARAMRRHREHRRLPIIIVLKNSDILERLDSRAGADVILTDHIGEDLAGQIEALTRRARLTAAMRAFLSQTSGEGVVDRVSKMFTGKFFAKHAARLFVRADETGRQLSLVGVTVSTESQDSAVQSRTMAQAANVIRRVVRAEDAVARISPNTFILMAAATAVQDCTRIAARVEGIIANTTYRAGGGTVIFKTSVQAAAIARTPGERIEETTARLLASLQQSTRRARRR